MQPNRPLSPGELQGLGDEIRQIQDRLVEIQRTLEARCGEESSMHYRAAESTAALQRLIWEFERQTPRVLSATA